MFIVPAIVALIVGSAILFVGKDEPEDKEVKKLDGMNKFEVLKKYVITNPWIWTLCVANVFVYIVRIEIDNWALLYVIEKLHFPMNAAVDTIFYFEMGPLLGNLT